MAELVDALVSNTNDSNVVPVRSRLRVLWNGIRFSTENFPTAYCDKVSCGILYLFLTGPCDGNNSRTPQKQLNYIKHNYPTRYGAPLKRCNSLRNWAVAFFIEGEVTKRQRFSFPLLALVITTSNNCCKGS